MVKFHQENNLCLKVSSVHNSQFQQPGQLPIVVTQKPLIVLSQKIDHRKAERVPYRIGIRISGVSV
jgi:hypothetical protein